MPVVDPDRILAQIVKVTKIVPINGADRIELASVLGWEVVIAKGDFKVDDLGIYFSIDAVLDSTKDYAKVTNGKPLKTKKIRGAISQGLLAPLSWVLQHETNPPELKEGDNVTTLMNVKKYVIEIGEYASDQERLPFPHFIPKTDEERIQNIPNVLEKITDSDVVITKKFDGTSTTFVFSKIADVSKFLVCSRNHIINDPSISGVEHYFEIAKKYKIEDKLKVLGKNIAIQGEICGPKIGNNRHKLQENDYFVFNIYDINKKCYLSHNDVVVMCKVLELKMVDTVYIGKMKAEWIDRKKLMELAESQEYSKGVLAEGIVIKLNKESPRLSFKIISNKYLIKHNL